MYAKYAPVAQLDRVTDSDSVGRWFESSRAYHEKSCSRMSTFVKGKCPISVSVKYKRTLQRRAPSAKIMVG